MGRRLRLTKALEGRPVDLNGSDGLTYHGRIVKVNRCRWVVIDYHVPGRSGEYRAYLDGKCDRERIAEVY
jgi:hypothetical protein